MTQLFNKYKYKQDNFIKTLISRNIITSEYLTLLNIKISNKSLNFKPETKTQFYLLDSRCSDYVEN